MAALGLRSSCEVNASAMFASPRTTGERTLLDVEFGPQTQTDVAGESSMPCNTGAGNHYGPAGFCLSMIFSENRFTLFPICSSHTEAELMLLSKYGRAKRAQAYLNPGNPGKSDGCCGGGGGGACWRRGCGWVCFFCCAGGGRGGGGGSAVATVASGPLQSVNQTS